MPHKRWLILAVAPAMAVAILIAGCTRQQAPAEPRQSEPLQPPPAERRPRPVTASLPRDPNIVRATGIVQALESQSVRVPQMTGVSGFEMILTRLIPNGARVAKGDLMVEFDRTQLLDQERDAVAVLEDLAHQLEERKAQVRSQQATRGSQIREAQADLERAQLQLRKGPVLSDLDRMKNEAKAETARLRLDSLRGSDALRLKSEEASVQVLALKHQRQQVTLERLRTNLERLVIKAPQDGMIAHEVVWRQGSMGPPQVGDRMWPGMPVLRVFNPSRMVVQATVDEPDFAVVSNASRARVFLDAYPDEAFEATLQSASPVATSGLDSPVRNFLAIFRIEQQSPRLLPDLSAALEIERGKAPAETAAEHRPVAVAQVKP